MWLGMYTELRLRRDSSPNCSGLLTTLYTAHRSSDTTWSANPQMCVPDANCARWTEIFSSPGPRWWSCRTCSFEGALSSFEMQSVIMTWNDVGWAVGYTFALRKTSGEMSHRDVFLSHTFPDKSKKKELSNLVPSPDRRMAKPVL